jgi:hypothetical protein
MKYALVRYLRAPDGSDAGAGGGGDATQNAGGDNEAQGAAGGKPGAKSGLTTGDQLAMQQEAAAAAAKAGNQGDALPDGWVKMDTRPEWLHERFYDAEKKAARFNDLAKSFGEAEKKLFTRTDDLKKQIEREFHEVRTKARPESPDKYEAKLPKDFSLPEGTTYTPDEAHPMMKWWRGFAHEQGFGQEVFEQGIAQFVMGLEHAAPDISAEIAKLGENGQVRVGNVETFIKANVGEQHAKALAPFVTSAAAVEALEAMIEKGMGKRLAVPNVQTGGKAWTKESLRAAQNDPRYYDSLRRDPAFVAEVQAGYQQLYGG